MGALCSLLDALLLLYSFHRKHSKDTFLLPLKWWTFLIVYGDSRDKGSTPKGNRSVVNLYLNRDWSVKAKAVYSMTARFAPCRITENRVIISMWYILFLFSGSGCLHTGLVTQSMCFALQWWTILHYYCIHLCTWLVTPLSLQTICPIPCPKHDYGQPKKEPSFNSPAKYNSVFSTSCKSDFSIPNNTNWGKLDQKTVH